MRYFPLSQDRFEHQFGIRALPADESIVEATDRYDDEIRLKRSLLDEDPDNYYQSLGGSEAACQEAAKLLLSQAEFLRGVTSGSAGETLDDTSLLSVARHLQEDVAILSGDSDEGNRLIAGIVCFPSGWSIRDKIGLPVLQVHAPVPEYAEVMGRHADRLLEQLKPGRPVWRMNWGVRPSHRLDQSPTHAEAIRAEVNSLTPENAGDRCQFRVERQTLSRLPNSQAILFTIHTHQCPINQLEQWQKKNLIGVLETCPRATLDYKGITSIREMVLAALRSDFEPSSPN